MRSSILALFLLTSSANAQTPDEQTKILALKLGYALNGNSMVRWGTIDLTNIHGSAKSVRVIPIEKEKKRGR